MHRKLKITVLVDESTVPADDPQFESPQEKTETEYHVIEALRDIGYKVSVVGAVNDVGTLVEKLSEHKGDLVFNLTEEFNGDRRLDQGIAGLLELLGLPYTGSGPAALMLCRDKRLCKELLNLHKIRVPGFLSLPVGKSIHVPKNIHWPLVVKPAFEDSSEGISNASVVYDTDALTARAMFVHDRWNQAAIAEEYIEGREFYVTVVGNKQLTVLPIRECLFEASEEGGPLMATYRVKWDREFREKWKISFGFAELDDKTLNDISRTCKKVFRALHLRDYGRIDLRLTPSNRIVVLEANPNPDLAYGEEVAEAAEKAGIGYNKFIDRIVHNALHRYK
jgi:D-alanine-D-alanine ligase